MNWARWPKFREATSEQGTWGGRLISRAGGAFRVIKTTVLMTEDKEGDAVANV
jgi:hypothetical protein